MEFGQNPQPASMLILIIFTLALGLASAASNVQASRRAESCSAPFDRLEGYASGTTGGGSGSATTVTSCEALRGSLERGGIVRVSGIFNCGILDVKSNTTVTGVGLNSGFVLTSFRLRNVSNVIIRNLQFLSISDSDESITLDGATHVWIDHNEFINEGSWRNGNLSNSQLGIVSSDLVTVSWNWFQDHWKGSSIAHSASSEDAHVTFHHNWWWNIVSLAPSLRSGMGHIYSNCYDNVFASGFSARDGAKALVENNDFNVANRAIATDDSELEGFVTERNNRFFRSPTSITQTGHIEPPYEYM
ncbi:Pectate lyase A [Paramyrothecium foliicola]|nr:Pectate lyase A [Paramyrothecium foliicola]